MDDQHAAKAPLQGGQAWRVFFIFALAYVMSYGLRSVNAVVGPELMQELGLSNADLGMLSAAYFIGFAAMQLPLGVCLDKYGARRTEAALLALSVLGCVLFASSQSLLGLWLGRALIGIGVSSCLMAAYKAYRSWYPLALQSSMASRMLVAGTSGALCATIPVSAALPIFGWRGVFYFCAMVLALLSLVLFFGLRGVEQAFAQAGASKQTGKAVSAEAASHDLAKGVAKDAANDPRATSPSFFASLASYGPIFSDPYFIRLGILGLVNQGIFVALQTLWAGPWMMTVLQMSKQQSSQILFVLNLVLLFAYLALAWLAPRYIKSGREQGLAVEPLVGLGLGAAILLQMIMIAHNAPWTWLLWPMLALCFSCIALIQTHLSLSFPAHLAGRSNTAYNLLFFLGAFVAQAGIGWLIDGFANRGMTVAQAMRAAFACSVLIQAAALGFFIFSRARPAQGEPIAPY